MENGNREGERGITYANSLRTWVLLLPPTQLSPRRGLDGNVPTADGEKRGRFGLENQVFSMSERGATEKRRRGAFVCVCGGGGGGERGGERFWCSQCGGERGAARIPARLLSEACTVAPRMRQMLLETRRSRPGGKDAGNPRSPREGGRKSHRDDSHTRRKAIGAALERGHSRLP